MPADVLRRGPCRTCRAVIYLLEGVGWLHGPCGWPICGHAEPYITPVIRHRPSHL